MSNPVIPSRARAGTRDTTGEKLRGPCGTGEVLEEFPVPKPAVS